jgi:hypothetical protein
MLKKYGKDIFSKEAKPTEEICERTGSFADVCAKILVDIRKNHLNEDMNPKETCKAIGMCLRVDANGSPMVEAGPPAPVAAKIDSPNLKATKQEPQRGIQEKGENDKDDDEDADAEDDEDDEEDGVNGKARLAALASSSVSPQALTPQQKPSYPDIQLPDASTPEKAPLARSYPISTDDDTALETQAEANAPKKSNFNIERDENENDFY